MSQPHHLVILVVGVPAPAINSVIASATIRAILEDVEVIGIRNGFEWIMKGDTSRITPLTTDEVSRIHYRGGSHIGISRANPTKDPTHLERAIESLLRLNVSLSAEHPRDHRVRGLLIADTAGGDHVCDNT